MVAEARLESLKTRHAELEMALNQESQRPSPDDSILHELKRQKLRIKDEMARLTQH